MHRSEEEPLEVNYAQGETGHVDRRTFLSRTASTLGAVSLAGLGASEVSAQRGRPKKTPDVDDDIFFLSLMEVAAKIKDREITSVALTQATFARIEKYDEHLMSYATLMNRQALADAKRADREIVAGRYRGPLHGVPVAVKDLCFTKGVRTSGGMGALKDHVPNFDSTVVARLREAGAIIVGKLNLTEGAMGGYNPEFEVPVNPWDKTRWTGVSSSGSAVATAAGLCFASLGTDTGGSIRFPSAANGTVGLKPTWGRVSRYGVLDLAESLDHVGPITRRCADAAVVFEAIAGLDANDATTLPDDVPSMLSEIENGVEGLRIGVDESYISDTADAEVKEAVHEAVRELEKLGAVRVQITMPDTSQVPQAWVTICAAEAVVAHEAYYPSQSKAYGPWFRGFLMLGSAVTASALVKAHKVRATFNGEFARVMSEVDMMACPSMATPAYRINREEFFRAPVASAAALKPLRFTTPFDFSRHPTLSVPCGFSQDGLPMSLQLVGRHLAEARLCQAGHAYEEATEWHTMHPALDWIASG